jgi:hypothetical protein
MLDDQARPTNALSETQREGRVAAALGQEWVWPRARKSYSLMKKAAGEIGAK